MKKYTKEMYHLLKSLGCFDSDSSFNLELFKDVRFDDELIASRSGKIPPSHISMSKIKTKAEFEGIWNYVSSIIRRYNKSALPLPYIRMNAFCNNEPLVTINTDYENDYDSYIYYFSVKKYGRNGGIEKKFTFSFADLEKNVYTPLNNFDTYLNLNLRDVSSELALFITDCGYLNTADDVRFRFREGFEDPSYNYYFTTGCKSGFISGFYGFCGEYAEHKSESGVIDENVFAEIECYNGDNLGLKLILHLASNNPVDDNSVIFSHTEDCTIEAIPTADDKGFLGAAYSIPVELMESYTSLKGLKENALRIE